MTTMIGRSDPAARLSEIVGASVINPQSPNERPERLRVCGGRLSDFPGDDGGTVLDASGLFATPGLIDMHVHMAADPDIQVLKRDRRHGAGLLALIAVRNLAVALNAGITTVRDLGTPGSVAADVVAARRAGLVRIARPIVAGRPISAVNGHGSEFGMPTCNAMETVVAVTEVIDAGAGVVKLMMSGADRPAELSSQQLRSAVEAAHARGIPVAVHASFSEESVKAAVEAECDTIEHGYSVTEETLRQMAAKEVALCPTLTALRAVVEHADAYDGGPDHGLVRAASTALRNGHERFNAAMRAGVTIVAGTDAGVPFTRFGCLVDELEQYVDWGMSREAALRSATIDAARVLARGDVGRLNEGSRADIVLFRSDPRDSLAVLREPVAVVQGGRCVMLREDGRLERRTR